MGRQVGGAAVERTRMGEDGAWPMRCAAVRAIVPEAVTGPAAAVVFGALPHACGAGGVTEDYC